ncbi:DUF1931 family protein [Streptomyces tauricus]|uniref:DUF1931 family protein n=1 Tax=Streptomyces tauricus TaxID=68274 RepID=UPI003907EFD5
MHASVGPDRLSLHCPARSRRSTVPGEPDVRADRQQDDVTSRSGPTRPVQRVISDAAAGEGERRRVEHAWNRESPRHPQRRLPSWPRCPLPGSRGPSEPCDLLTAAQTASRPKERDTIQTCDLPITIGLQESIHHFRLEQLATHSALDRTPD